MNNVFDLNYYQPQRYFIISLWQSHNLTRMKKSCRRHQEGIQEKRNEEPQNKALHGQYLNDTDEKTDCKITWNWLKNGYLKKETEGFVIAAQDQAIRTNAIKARIDKTSSNSKCRLCKVKEETIDHLVKSCSEIAQTDYKEQHDKVASMLHWNL